MRWWSLLIVGSVLVAVGGVWVFQGIGALKGSFMTGSSFWGWAGAACVVAGLVVFGVASSHRGQPKGH